MPSSEILCVGELLWDSLPAGLFLGGAPFNVAAHLHALGVPAAMVTRVGADRLGTEALARLVASGVAADMVQIDPVRETGFVSVSLGSEGSPTYEIREPAAWDFVELRSELLERAARSRALVFGSLAQRNPISRGTIEQLRQVATCNVFDVNLRPPFDEPEVVRRSLACANIVKLNESELAQLSAWFGLPTELREATRAIAEQFGCKTVCVTRGAAGAVLLHRDRWTEHAGFRVEVRDTVGSGDAFLAALLAGLLAGDDDADVLQRANRLGAFVATQAGAIPAHPRPGEGAVFAPRERMGPDIAND